MQELLIVLGATLVVCALLTGVASRLGPALHLVERWLTYVSTALIIFLMFYVCGEVVMRYVFNSPIPGHLESAELFLPMVVFFGIAYTQSQHGHVGMSLIVDSLSPKVRRITESTTLVLSLLTCAVLAYFSTKYSYQLWEYDDVTMSPPYWRTWPSAASVPLGYLLVAMRMWFQVLHLFNPEKYPEPLQEHLELDAADEVAAEQAS